MFTIKTFVFNPFQENTYVVHDETLNCVIIDNGAHSESEKYALEKYLKDNNLNLCHLLNTHNHIDHILGNEFITKTFGISPKAHKEDDFLIGTAHEYGKMFGIECNKPPEVEEHIIENQELKFGNSILRTIFVPGHSPGHVVFYCEKEKVLFSGDVLFEGSIGRTDLPGGNFDQLISNIKNKLLTLPDETIVYPGHGSTTSISKEKETNTFLY